MPPTAATAPTTATALSPSTGPSRKASATHPAAAPAMSAAYSQLTWLGNRVSARQTAIPLKMNGTLSRE